MDHSIYETIIRYQFINCRHLYKQTRDIADIQMNCYLL